MVPARGHLARKPDNWDQTGSSVHQNGVMRALTDSLFSAVIGGTGKTAELDPTLASPYPSLLDNCQIPATPGPVPRPARRSRCKLNSQEV